MPPIELELAGRGKMPPLKQEHDSYREHSRPMEVHEDDGFEWGLKVEDESDYYESVYIKGEEYFLYDCVHCHSGGDIEFVGKIMKMWEERRSKRCQLRWFIRPEELTGSDYVPKSKELFLACGRVGVEKDNALVSSVLRMSEILSKCRVLCTAKNDWNLMPSAVEVRAADYFFRKAYDVDRQQVLNLDRLADSLGAQRVFNKKDWVMGQIPGHVSAVLPQVSPRIQVPGSVCYIRPEGDLANNSKEIAPGKVTARMLASRPLLAPAIRGPKRERVDPVSLPSKKPKVIPKVSVLASSNKTTKHPEPCQPCLAGNPRQQVIKSSDSKIVASVSHRAVGGLASRPPLSMPKVHSKLAGPSADENRKDKLHKNPQSFDNHVSRRLGSNDGSIAANQISKTREMHFPRSKEKPGCETKVHKPSIKKPPKPDSPKGGPLHTKPRKTDAGESGRKKLESKGLRDDASRFRNTQEAPKYPKNLVKVDQKSVTRKDVSTELRLPGQEKVSSLLEKRTGAPEKGKKPLTTGIASKRGHSLDVGIANIADGLQPGLPPLVIPSQAENSQAVDMVSQLRTSGDDQRIDSSVQQATAVNRVTVADKGKAPAVDDYDDFQTGVQQLEVKEIVRPQVSGIFKYKDEVWEDTIDRALELRKVLHFKNLDPSLNSWDIQEALTPFLRIKCEVRILPPPSFTSYRSAEALVKFPSPKVAEETLRRMQEQCLILDGRSVFASLAERSRMTSISKFCGHISVRDTKNVVDAIATSHCAQGNTIEFPMGCDWRKLQLQQVNQWEALSKAQDEDEEHLRNANGVRPAR